MASPIGWRQPGATLRTSSKRSVKGTPFPLRAQRQMALYSPSERLLWAITLAIQPLRGLWLCCLAGVLLICPIYILHCFFCSSRLLLFHCFFCSSRLMNSFHAVQQTSA